MYINSRVPTIKFTLEASSDSISFLDVNMCKDDHLSTSMYTKKADTNSYLHFASYHPPGLKKSVLSIRLLRIRRMCNKGEVLM